MAERNVDVYAARLGDPALELKHKFMIAQELRDAIEFLTQGPMYAPFLKKLMPIILKLLETPPVFISTSWEQVGPSMQPPKRSNIFRSTANPTALTALAELHLRDPQSITHDSSRRTRAIRTRTGRSANGARPGRE